MCKINSELTFSCFLLPRSANTIHNSVSLPELAFMLETFCALVSWKYHSLPYLSVSEF